MKSIAVVERQVAFQRVVDVVVGVEATAMIDLRLHRMEEGLDEGVIGDLAGTVHALSEAQFGDSLLEGASSVFDAPVGVEHQL